jgi:hypothetical protein
MSCYVQKIYIFQTAGFFNTYLVQISKPSTPKLNSMRKYEFIQVDACLSTTFNSAHNYSRGSSELNGIHEPTLPAWYEN